MGLIHTRTKPDDARSACDDGKIYTKIVDEIDWGGDDETKELCRWRGPGSMEKERG